MKIIKDLGMIANKSGNRFRMLSCECPQCLTVYDMYAHNFKRMKGNVCAKCVKINRNTTHGLSHTKAYQVWNNMMGRCYRPSYKNFARWGGRGISVCSDWQDFEVFKIWFDEKHKDGLELDRRNNDEGYSPDNCRFVSSSVNMENQNKRKGCSSKYKYVYYSNQAGNFIAKYKGKYLGLFTNEEEAYLAVSSYLNKIKQGN